jgi:hypothetical protein
VACSSHGRSTVDMLGYIGRDSIRAPPEWISMKFSVFGLDQLRGSPRLLYVGIPGCYTEGEAAGA